MIHTINEFIKHLEKIMPEKGSYHIINEKKLLAEKKAIIVEAHPDDAALAEGLDVKLARQGVGIVIVTFTDGGARFGPGNNEQLIAKRRKESIESARVSHAGMVINLGYPDGELSNVEPHAIETFSQIVSEINPDFVISPHEFDDHLDHASAYKIAKKAVNGSLPLYAMDTITRKTSFGQPVVPTHYFPLSQEEKQIRDNAYLAHESQVTNLPPEEMQAVHDVLDLPQKRGKELRVPYAGIVVKDASGNGNDPLGEILGK
jgi:LmbE family N-acetylglucosaminyl deacetylase